MISILTEAEFETTQALAVKYAETPVAREACQIVTLLFQDAASLGVLRFREHPLFTAQMDIVRFLAVLKAVFPNS